MGLPMFLVGLLAAFFYATLAYGKGVRLFRLLLSLKRCLRHSV